MFVTNVSLFDLKLVILMIWIILVAVPSVFVKFEGKVQKFLQLMYAIFCFPLGFGSK